MSEYKVYTIYNKPPKKNTPAGEHIQLEHRLVTDKNGKNKLVFDRKVDIYSKIQQGREETEIAYIMRRAQEGDFSLLDAVKAQYMDVTDAPQSLAQAQQLLIDYTNTFHEMPWEIRREYNNDPKQYIADIGSKHWCDVVGITKAQEEKERKQSLIEQDQKIHNLAEGTGIKAAEGSEN